MPRTPDRFPGTREDEGIVLEPGAVEPSNNGEVRYVTSVGFKVREEGATKRLLSREDHRAIRQLIHFIDDGPAEDFASGAFKEVLPLGVAFPTQIIWWGSSAKTGKIVELNITRDGTQKPTAEEWKVYDTNGTTVLLTVTDAITYSGPFEKDRTRTIV